MIILLTLTGGQEHNWGNLPLIHFLETLNARPIQIRSPEWICFLRYHVVESSSLTIGHLSYACTHDCWMSCMETQTPPLQLLSCDTTTQIYRTCSIMWVLTLTKQSRWHTGGTWTDWLKNIPPHPHPPYACLVDWDIFLLPSSWSKSEKSENSRLRLCRVFMLSEPVFEIF